MELRSKQSLVKAGCPLVYLSQLGTLCFGFTDGYLLGLALLSKWPDETSFNWCKLVGLQVDALVLLVHKSHLLMSLDICNCFM